MGDRALRVANVSGFFGDRMNALREMVLGGPVDVITGDYLAEVTMSVLWKLQQRDPDAGYAPTFLHQLARCWTRSPNGASASSSTPEGSTPPAWPPRSGS
jgi:hypothetical protein